MPVIMTSRLFYGRMLLIGCGGFARRQGRLGRAGRTSGEIDSVSINRPGDVSDSRLATGGAVGIARRAVTVARDYVGKELQNRPARFLTALFPWPILDWAAKQTLLLPVCTYGDQTGSTKGHRLRRSASEPCFGDEISPHMERATNAETGLRTT